MYFYVDESGHTGPQLFDRTQPTLYYGLLSSPANLDAVAAPDVQRLRARLGVAQLHAADLPMPAFEPVAAVLKQLQKRYQRQFDCYRVEKRDHAVICFFDQVFDCHCNPAVAWHHYWTPLRYLLFVRVAFLFDEELARQAWEARIMLNGSRASSTVETVCKSLLARLDHIQDKRSRQVIGEALEWAASHPEALSYNADSSASSKAVMPNVVGFQHIMIRIADRVRKLRSRRVSIVVDQQSQFNTSQRALAEWYRRARGNVFPMGPGMPSMDLRGIPDASLTISGGTNSPGLELADVYLWSVRRFLEGKEVPQPLAAVVGRQLSRMHTDEISIKGIVKRWGTKFVELRDPGPQEMEQSIAAAWADGFTGSKRWAFAMFGSILHRRDEVRSNLNSIRLGFQAIWAVNVFRAFDAAELELSFSAANIWRSRPRWSVDRRPP